MLRLFFTLLFLFTVCTCGRAQKEGGPADSLYLELLAMRTDDLGWTDSLAPIRLDSLRELATKLNTPRAYALSDAFNGDYLRHKGKPDTARLLIERGLDHFKTVRDSVRIAHSLFALASAYLPVGDFENAFTYFEEALYYHRALGNSRMEIASLNALGVVLRRSKQSDRALEYFEKSFVRAQEIEDRDLALGALNNRAIIHKRRKEYALAIELYEQGLALAAQPPKSNKESAYFNLNLGSCFSSQGKPEQSLVYAEKAYAWFSHAGSEREKTMNLIGLAVNYADVGQTERSLAMARELEPLAGKESNLTATVHELFSKAFTLQQNADSAVYHLKAAQQVRNKLAEEKRTSSLDEMETRFQTREKQMEIDRLEAEEVATTRRLRTRGYIIGATLLGIALLGWLLWRNLRQRNLIEQQNETITKALGEKELLLKEIHHRVKNNLQMVSSLLNMQTHYIKDSVAADALQLGRSRVRSMALIHQKLYTTDEVSTLVEAKDYLERLVREIVDTHAPTETKVQLQLDVEPLEMDIDTLVPLGLITNEAVTNAVKYAFAGRTQGVLKVRLWQREGQHTLTITDNGPGLRPSVDDQESFGQLLMTTLAEQLEGTFKVKDSPDGVEVVVKF